MAAGPKKHPPDITARTATELALPWPDVGLASHHRAMADEADDRHARRVDAPVRDGVTALGSRAQGCHHTSIADATAEPALGFYGRGRIQSNVFGLRSHVFRALKTVTAVTSIGGERLSLS